jgi:uncharacterized membrane protein YqhA
MAFLGATKTVKSFEIYFGSQGVTTRYEHLVKSDLAMISLIESVDAFLFSLVLLIFAYGILQIFILKNKLEPDNTAPSWLRITSVSELKQILIEVVIVILFVFFLKVILIHIEKASWEMLILPFSILLLSMSLYLIKKSGK